MRNLYLTITFLFFSLLNLMAETITVTTNAESGAGSLQQAITDASSGDIIVFDQAYTIYLTSPLELGDKSITIDGDVNSEMVKLDGNFKDEDGDWIDDDGVFTNLFLVISSGEFTVNVNNMIIQNGSVSDDDWGGAWPSSDMYLGGGVYIDLTDGGTFTMTGCSIQNNTLSQMDTGYDGVNQTYLRGAGICSVKGGSFINCVIKNNTSIATNSNISNIDGAGAYIEEGGSFSKCLVAGNRILFAPINNLNSFSGIGGGLSLGHKAEVINCVIVGNLIENISDELTGYSNNAYAGGIIATNAHVYNTTIVSNGIYNLFDRGDLDGIACGGAYLTYKIIGDTEYKDYCDYQNNIIYNNFCSSGDFNDAATFVDKTKYTAISDVSDFDINLYENCIVLDENPFFELPSAGNDGEWGTDDDDYGDLRLKENSPCIDAGNPESSQLNLPTTDFYGRPRISNNRIDMGVVESFYTDFYFTLEGNVWEGSSACIAGKVYAYDVNDNSTYVAVADLNEDGAFELTSIAPGDYYLMAVPENTQDYQTTYFGDETTVQKAICITIDDYIYGVDIHLVEVVSTTVEMISNEIKIYPNPATSFINIDGVESYSKIRLINGLGAIVYEYNGEVNQIPISNLSKGIYLVEIETEGQRLYYKVLKQ